MLIANYTIILFGILILFIGAVIVTKPDTIFGLIRDHSESIYVHVVAVVVRLILGVVLIAYAAESKYPIALQVLGWLSISAAIVLAVIGRSRFKRLMTWALSFSSSFGRYAGIFAIAFGCFLIYAVV